MAVGSRNERIDAHERNPKWKNVPLRIEMSECINCDKCLDPCPVDCIYPDPDWTPAPDEWWTLPLSALDPYK